MENIRKLRLSIDDFETLECIGRGAFGEVNVSWGNVEEGGGESSGGGEGEDGGERRRCRERRGGSGVEEGEWVMEVGGARPQPLVILPLDSTAVSLVIECVSRWCTTLNSECPAVGLA